MDVMNIARATVTVFLNSPAKRLANFVGIDDGRIDEMYVDLSNKIDASQFERVPASDVMVFLPHCLRNEKCPAPQDEDGYHCKECGKCKIADAMRICRKMGSKVFILPGGSMLPRLLSKHKPKAVVGVACFRELSMAVCLVTKLKIPLQAVFLSKDGCKDTDFDVYELKQVLEHTRR